MPTDITGKDGLLYATFAFRRLLWTLLLPCFYLSLVLTAILFLFIMGVRTWLQMKRKTRRAQDGRPAVAFFHPYCNAGGGGERVLWCALRALQNRSAISALLDISPFIWPDIYGSVTNKEWKHSKKALKAINSIIFNYRILKLLYF